MENEIEDRGQLWVMHSLSEKTGGVFRSYDVFGTDGTWLCIVDVIVDGDRDEDGLTPLPDGRFLLITGLEEASDTMNAGFGGDHSEEETDLDDAAPLGVISFHAGDGFFAR